MSPDATRRFTDQEVALVLRKAAEIDEAEGSEPKGLSIADLRQIAREVGLSPGAIDRAVAGLDKRRAPAPLLRGAPLVRRAAHAVPGDLSEEAIARLIRLVDERAATAGSVTEALGSVRWTSSDRVRSQQVSITASGGETAIQVVEKAAPGARFVVHFVPAIWGWVAAGIAVGALGITGGGLAAAMAAGVLAGATAGRLVWDSMSAMSAGRVERLAAELSREAHEAAGRGLIAPGD
jgi:hypothetical protein